MAKIIRAREFSAERALVRWTSPACRAASARAALDRRALSLARQQARRFSRCWTAAWTCITASMAASRW
jgi:hypothetical protein